MGGESKVEVRSAEVVYVIMYYIKALRHHHCLCIHRIDIKQLLLDITLANYPNFVRVNV